MYAITLYCIEKSKSGTREGSYRFAKMQKSERGSNSQQGKLVAVECKGKHYKKILSPPRPEQQNEKSHRESNGSLVAFCCKNVQNIVYDFFLFCGKHRFPLQDKGFNLFRTCLSTRYFFLKKVFRNIRISLFLPLRNRIHVFLSSCRLSTCLPLLL